MKQTLQLIDGSTTVFTVDNEDTDSLLTRLEGWEEYAGVSLDTVDKGIGAGSYIISKHLSEREVQVDFLLKSGGFNLKMELQQLILKLDPYPVTLRRTVVSNNVTVTEDMQVHLTGLVATSVTIEGQYTFTLNFVAVNPYKVGTRNGVAFTSL